MRLCSRLLTSLKAAYFAQGCDPHPTYRPTATLLALIAASSDSNVKGF
jgi:hypothetical protein